MDQTDPHNQRMIKNRREPYSFHWTCAALAGFAFLAGCASAPVPTEKSTGWVKDEVSDSYVFGYPLVVMDIARDAAVGSGPGQAAVNTLRHAQALPPVGAANPTMPSLDTFDSTGWLDVADEPVIVSLPDSRGRYVDARALDMWTNVVWSTGDAGTTRVTGIKAQKVAFAAAGWKGDLPAGVKRIDVPTRYVWLSVRIQTARGRDLAAVRKLQRAIRVAPLSAYTGDARPAPQVARNSGAGTDSAATVNPVARVAALDANGFFSRLAQALPDNPPAPDDPHALKILSDLGVAPGQPVALPAAASDAVAAGFSDGRDRVATAPSNLLSANGWSWASDNAGAYGSDYALRAYTAFTELGLGTKDDEVRAVVSQDSDGHALNGANRYVIHFAAKQLPPVRGFWSITAYTKDGALGESAPAHISLSDRYGLRRSRDGSVDVYVSAVGSKKTPNWVPAPRSDFKLVLRLYAPKPQATDGSWEPPAVERQ